MPERVETSIRKNRKAPIFFMGNVVKYEQSEAQTHKLPGGDPVIGWIIVGLFTSFGLLCAGMVLYGMVFFRCLSGTAGWLIVPEQERGYAAYYRWLKSMGILSCRILEVDLPDDLDDLIEKADRDDSAV